MSALQEFRNLEHLKHITIIVHDDRLNESFIPRKVEENVTKRLMGDLQVWTKQVKSLILGGKADNVVTENKKL